MTRDSNNISERMAPALETGPLVWPAQTIRFAVFAAVVCAAFSLPLIHLSRFSWNSLLFSYIPFVPIMSGTLIWLDRERLPQRTTRGWIEALVCGVAGLALLADYWATLRASPNLEETQGLAFTTAAFLLFFLAAAFYFYGASFMRAIAFPVIFCCFIVPFPNFLLDPVVNLMRIVSAWLAHVFLSLAGTPSVQERTTLILANTSLEVTDKCSGFHAGIALVLTSMFGGYLFLRSGWNRLWFALAAVPLALVRNGFRVFVLSEMCVSEGTQALDSPMHTQGGKLFFAISLVPLFLFLIYLHKTEKRPQSV